MNGTNRFVIDTNISIFYLKGHDGVKKYFDGGNAIFSFVNELELLSGAYFNEDELIIIKRFLEDHVIIEYLPELKNIIIKLRSQKRLKLPDAIIAATALYLQLPLVSADKSFSNIDGLDFIYHEPAAC